MSELSQFNLDRYDTMITDILRKGPASRGEIESQANMAHETYIDHMKSLRQRGIVGARPGEREVIFKREGESAGKYRRSVTVYYLTEKAGVGFSLAASTAGASEKELKILRDFNTEFILAKGLRMLLTSANPIFKSSRKWIDNDVLPLATKIEYSLDRLDKGKWIQRFFQEEIDYRGWHPSDSSRGFFFHESDPSAVRDEAWALSVVAELSSQIPADLSEPYRSLVSEAVRLIQDSPKHKLASPKDEKYDPKDYLHLT